MWFLQGESKKIQENDKYTDLEEDDINIKNKNILGFEYVFPYGTSIEVKKPA